MQNNEVCKTENIKISCGEINIRSEPKAGLEPATYSLRMSYSTN